MVVGAGEACELPPPPPPQAEIKTHKSGLRKENTFSSYTSL
jgi:hypothetical protein